MEFETVAPAIAHIFFPGTSFFRTVRSAFLAFTFGIIASIPKTVQSGDAVIFTVLPSRSAYITGDTVILAVKAQIKPQYYLYGNPVGPGGGRPLIISIGQKYPAVRWLEVKKPKADKIGPPFGDWVWAYRKETVFFCRGVVVQHNKNGVMAHNGSIELDGLLCRDACRLQHFTLPFSINIGPRSYTTGDFFDDPEMLRKYVVSVPMAALAAENR